MTARDYLVDHPEKKEEEESKHTRITIRMCMMDVQSVSQAKKSPRSTYRRSRTLVEASLDHPLN